MATDKMIYKQMTEYLFEEILEWYQKKSDAYKKWVEYKVNDNKKLNQEFLTEYPHIDSIEKDWYINKGEKKGLPYNLEYGKYYLLFWDSLKRAFSSKNAIKNVENIINSLIALENKSFDIADIDTYPAIKTKLLCAFSQGKDFIGINFKSPPMEKISDLGYQWKDKSIFEQNYNVTHKLIETFKRKGFNFDGNHITRILYDWAGLGDYFGTRQNKELDIYSHPSIEDYRNFKKLLEFFVKQLRINTGSEEGTPHYGREKTDWFEDANILIYSFVDFAIHFQNGFQSHSNSNYMNYWGCNIVANWIDNKSDIKELEIYVNNDGTANNNVKHEDIFNKSPDELGLFDNKEPNKILKDFFDIYVDLCKIWSGENMTDINIQSDLLHKNLIYFGAPGTGKSYQLNEVAKINFPDRCSRVTFYSNYSYGQFIGMYKPWVESGEITYRFVPGPFIDTIVKAVKDPDNNYLLIIEEINRADAASVFGDTFQLLDRNPDGESEYTITPNEDLKKYLKEQDIDNNELKIPSNMFIYATMNSADQGVFPLDTAFKRRWRFKYIDIKNGDNVQDLWKNWVDQINDFLIKNDVEEDKCLGYHFLSNDIISNEAPPIKLTADSPFSYEFKNKVIMYLFEDAGRFIRDKLFGVPSTLSNLFNRYDAWMNTDSHENDILKILNSDFQQNSINEEPENSIS